MKLHNKISVLSQIIIYPDMTLSGYSSYYVSKTDYLPLQIHYKLQGAQWPNEYSVHKVTQYIHLKCELHVTLKMKRAACSLSDADSHFYTMQNIRVR